jgi:hypothetical protein
MTRTEQRLTELVALSRIRSLTDEEQREVMLRAKQERRNRKRKALYWTDPHFRERRIEDAREYRRNTPGYWRSKQC